MPASRRKIRGHAAKQCNDRANDGGLSVPARESVGVRRVGGGFVCYTTDCVGGRRRGSAEGRDRQPPRGRRPDHFAGGTGQLVVEAVARLERTDGQPDRQGCATRKTARPVPPRVPRRRADVARTGVPAPWHRLCPRRSRRAHQGHRAGVDRRAGARLRHRLSQQTRCGHRRDFSSGRGRGVPNRCDGRADRHSAARGRRPQQRSAGFQGAVRRVAGGHGLLQARVVRGVRQAGRVQARRAADGAVAAAERQGNRYARRAGHRVDRHRDLPAASTRRAWTRARSRGVA